MEFGIPEELVLQLSVLVGEVGLALLTRLRWSFLLCLQCLEKSAMDLLEGMRREEEKAVFPIDSFDDSSLFGVVGCYLIVLAHDEILHTLLFLLLDLIGLVLVDHLRTLLFVNFIGELFFNLVYYWKLNRIRLRLLRGFLCLLDDFFLEVVVLSGKKPGGRILPNIPAIIQYQMVLFFGGQYFLEGLTLQIAILVSAYYIREERFLVLQEQQWFRIPSAKGMDEFFPRVLCPNVLANLLSVDAGSLGVDVYLVVLGDDVEKVLEVGPHLHDDQILAVGQSLERPVDLGYDVVLR